LAVEKELEVAHAEHEAVSQALAQCLDENFYLRDTISKAGRILVLDERPKKRAWEWSDYIMEHLLL
jgi:hypothetical protein